MTIAIAHPSDLELAVTRRFDAPPAQVFAAWTTPAQMMQWWTPASFPISFVSCAIDARSGGSYRFVMRHADMPEPLAFHGHYLDVVPDARLVWTNEEAGEAGQLTTVTFDAEGAATLLTLTERYPDAAARAEAEANGSVACFGEMFDQLDALLHA